MLSGLNLILFFMVLIVLMIVSIAKLKLHPFLAIMSAALLLALSALPLDKVPSTIGAGFAATFSSLGIVIILGALIGSMLEQSGAALTMADTVIRLVGRKFPDLAMVLMGWLVSISVFCDSGYVMLTPIRKAMARRTGASTVTMVVALAAGLYTSHVFIPPTPGPIAAAESLGIGSNMLMLIIFGTIVSVPVLLAGWIFARFAKRWAVSAEDSANEKDVQLSYEELKAKYGKMPGAAAAFAPIILPIVLMAAKSVADMLKMSGFCGELLRFLGTPMISLAAGLVIAVICFSSSMTRDEFYTLVNDSLKVVGPILFITAGGAVLGKVINDAKIVHYITGNLPGVTALGIFFPFILAALLKTAQGSSTVAIVTTAGIMGLYSAGDSMMAALGLTTPVSAVLTVMAIGAGAMTVSHANDSYFWVVTNFGGLKPLDGYKTFTVCTLVMGIVGIVAIWLLNTILTAFC